MNELPVSVDRVLRRLSRRLTLGLFLDVWPPWAVASLLLAGVAVIACRLFVPGAASRLHWLWIAPLLTVVPALVIVVRRSYRPAEVAALADSLSGGHGRLLTLLETRDPAWAETPGFARVSTFPLPHLRPWRALSPIAPSAVFLLVALWLPQRIPAGASSTIVADEIAAGLSATVAE